MEQSLATAVNLINSTSPNADNDLYIIFCELFDFIKATYVMDCQRAKGFSYPNLAAANSTFSVLAVLTKLIDLCAQLITEPMMQRHPTFENDKRICLEHGLQFCEDGMSPLKYFAGYQQVQRGNSYVQEETFKKAASPSYDMHKFYSDKFKTDFNNLPTTRSALMGYDSEIAKLQNEIDAYTLGLDAYLNANPALKKAYHKSVKPFLIPLAALFTLFVIYIGSYAGDFSSPKFLAIAIIASLIIVALGVLAIVYAIQYSNERRQILNSLPRELSYLKNIHDQSQQRLRTVNQQKAAFLKTNTKR